MIAGSRFLPTPVQVAVHVGDLAMTGPLLGDFARTLGRATFGFVAAMVIGACIGALLGRFRALDQLFGPWILVALNLPAIVIAILCYIGLGLCDFALVLAVVINKVPLVATTIREGVRSFGPEYEDLARALRMPSARRVRLIFLPQLMPFLMVAARTGLALIWKMVLVFEILGSDGGVGFRVGLYFQFFDMTGILAYAVVFVGLIMALEQGLLRPLEQRTGAWRLARA